MTDPLPADGLPVDRDRERALQPVAREWVRGWARSSGAIGFEEVGRDAIRRSAEAIARLSRAADSPSPERVLAEVEAAAAALAPPPPVRARWWSRARPAPSGPLPQERLATIAQSLDRHRDDVTRRLIALRTDRDALAAADRAVEDVVHLLRALAATVEAAVREWQREDPARVAQARTAVSEALPERQQAVLTQLAIVRQARLTVDILIANEQALGAALDQARSATLSAIQVALAARRAVEQGGDADDAAARRAQRLLADAVAEARAALDSPPPPVLR